MLKKILIAASSIALCAVLVFAADQAQATLTLGTTSVASSGNLQVTAGVTSLSGTLVVGNVVATPVDLSATVGAAKGLQMHFKNTGATVTSLKGIDARVTDDGGTADDVAALQGAAFKVSGVSTGELWGTNSVVSMTGGSVVNAYGVVGDLTIGADATISTTQKNGYATAGLFTSYIAGTVANAIDSAVIAQISGDDGRVKSTQGTFGVVSLINGSAGTESSAGASAAFKVMNFNTNSGKFDYGLDTYYSSGSFRNLFNTADIRMQNGDTISNSAASSTTISGTVVVNRVATPIQTVTSATAFPINGANVVTPTGTTGIATITGGVAGQLLTLIFTTAIVVTDDDTATAANAINLVGAATNFTSVSGDTLMLIHDGNAWREISRSVNN